MAIGMNYEKNMKRKAMAQSANLDELWKEHEEEGDGTKCKSWEEHEEEGNGNVN
jgi:hypothetical protein